MTLPVVNFGAWCIQVALVIAAGALVPWIFDLKSPKIRLAYWHVLLVACLALPFMQPWRAQPVLAVTDVSFSTGPARPVTSHEEPRFNLTAGEAVGGVLACGVLIRLMWLCSGLWRLRRLRRASEALLPLPEEARRMTRRLGVTADFYVSREVRSPVTFGARPPVILLPVGFLRLDAAKREPIICHELLHIQRSDWLFAIGEELVRCALWFHPAIWWLLGKIQLTREQVVDQSVIEYTNEAGVYVDALIAIASTRLEADLAPAPLFLKKRHLRQRVDCIVKGVKVSKRRLLLSTLAAFSSLPLVVGIAAWEFPLNAAPQEVQDAQGVEVRVGSFRVLHRTGVIYPLEAREKGIGGTVVVSVSVNARGEVSDARIVSGPEELRKAALSAVLNWHFAVDAGSAQTFDVVMSFNAGQAVARRLQRPADVSDPQEIPLFLERLDLSRLPAELQEKVRALNLPRTGEPLMNDRMRQLMEDVRAVDPHITSTVSASADKLTIRLGLGGTATGAAEMPRPENLGSDRLRVGGNEQATHLITKVPPIYPALAKQARIQGTVRFEVVIGKDGHVMNIRLISGHPLFVPSTTDAVKQWVYTPTLLNGNPVEVVTQVDVNFSLSDGGAAPPPAVQQ